MANIQEEVQVLFDAIESSDCSSDGSNTTSNSARRDYHQEQYESYVPPHKRGHNLQNDKFVNHKKNNDQDRAEGVDHDKYQRLMLPVPFALPRNKLKVLKGDFPGVFFHCKDNNNHDHPYSHVATMVGTRFMQRRIKAGSRVLDVYGNPNACDRFNTSQVSAAEPKFMKAIVNRSCPADFIREVNKWGPFFDTSEGIERYYRGSLMSLVNAGELKDFDVLQFVHTLYYVPLEELCAALHAPGRRVAYALVHRHRSSEGTINDGEQRYEKKYAAGMRLVKQTNISTGSTYVHPDLTDLLFAERKVWFPRSTNATRSDAEQHPSKGLTWECHMVNEDTWVVEIVAYTEPDEGDGFIDYAALWDDDEMLSSDDFLSDPSPSGSSEIRLEESHVVIPTLDGKFLSLKIPCKELFEHLRMRASGRQRTPKLLEDLISTANHLVNPSTLFGDKVGMRCPPDKIYDVAVAAWAVDVLKEDEITRSVACLRPVLQRHARGMKLGPKYKDWCLSDLLGMMRLALQGAKDVNAVLKHKDPVDLALHTVLGYTE